MQDLSEKQRASLHDRGHESTIIGKTYITSDFRFLRPNEQLCKLLGYTIADLEGKTFTEITPDVIAKIDVANARSVMEGRSDYYALPKIYQPRKDAPPIYAMISVLPSNKENGDFQCFYVEIMQIGKQEWLRLTKELLRSHPELLENQYSLLTGWLSFLTKYSYKELADLSVRISIVGLAAFVALKEGKEKALSLLGALF